MNENAIPSAPDDVVRVFVSYAREDRRWLDPDYRFSLIPFLTESLRRHRVVFWFDKELKPGDEFGRLILSQIEQSQIALLIVSQNFLNSEFIENREMPRIAERARLGQMIVVPVLVEPCDWSEYPFLADRQMVPSSPLIDYTESEPQWAKVRFQILDGLKAQLKRIREAPQMHTAPAAALNAHDAPPEETIIEADAIPSSQPGPWQQDEQPGEELDRVARKAAEREAAAQAALRAEKEAEQIRQQQEREAEERRRREKELGDQRRKEAAGQQAREEAQRREADLQRRRGTEGEAKARHENPADAEKKPTIAHVLDKARIWTAWIIVAFLAIAVCAWIFWGVESVYHRLTAPSAATNPSQAQTGSGPPSGTVWVARNSGTTQQLISIFGTRDGTRLWAVGDKGMIVESDDRGASWTERNSGTTEPLRSVFGTSDGRRLWADGNEGAIVGSDDGGATWTVRNSGTTQQLFSIFGTSNGRHLWAAGMAGTILESDDGGKSWTTRRGGIDEWLYMIFGTSDGKRLWVVGDAGRVLESSDRGTTWAIRNSDPAESVITSIFGTSDGKRLWAVAAGGTILESNDGGDNWAARGSVAYGNAYSIFGTSDGQRLWAVGYSGAIVESDDGGASWTSQNSGESEKLNSIFGTSDGQHLWVVGDNGTILESDR
jgi:photosystem II stability/assembly factor-like uncharacterized protein